ncbi:N-acetylmuramoyl-L-alanine amidase [Latimeria chalumnae]|uniref:N-acetylmuramoyl-L-alanine amidase n=1 Tax=Latimeria chalumnae TaxID=7897 RepID=UPI0003C13B1B|nr:PREDICTED: N-acetylmuramoyl-L-alanine amidase [Latimeria chalumnae]|eukprot:XP_006002990.1 PREDICTED: N-acetylmuramoyl-L-alanine amidase [Latimeria chalumnae]
MASPRSVLELLRKASDYDDDYYRYLLGEISIPSTSLQFLTNEQKAFIQHFMRDEVNFSTENGVVLVHDGTTVAMGSVIVGIEAGLKRRDVPLPNARGGPSSTVDNLYAVALSKDIGQASLLFHLNKSQMLMGPDGCWDSVASPQIFTLMDSPSLATNALINGGFDGVILGNYFTENRNSSPKLSSVLRTYYSTEGIAGMADMRSNFRRRNFLKTISMDSFSEQVRNSVYLVKELSKDVDLEGVNESLIAKGTHVGLEHFHSIYLECPAVIPRCMWEAKPYKGTPTYLQLPLHFVYIHHTYEPGQPCRTFPGCAADMRSMQRFHQVDRGWDDIGYSFVVGSDGYLYEGRGWFWQGAHTLGHNSIGYGVSFIGDYTSTLPEGFAMDLVKENFLKCAVQGSKIISSYTIYGHRQVVQTSCPGDTLFNEIKTWKGFKDVPPKKQNFKKYIHVRG